MTLELILLLISLHVEDLNGGVLVGNDDVFVGLIKDGAVGAGETAIELEGFLDHSDIPHFIDSIGVTTDDHVSSQVEPHSVN